MTWAFIIIGVVIAVDSLFGYQLALGRARRSREADALSRYERRCRRGGLRSWGITTGAASIVGGAVGASFGPGFGHGFMMVAGSSIVLALPAVYIGGTVFARRAARLGGGPRI